VERCDLSLIGLSAQRAVELGLASDERSHSAPTRKVVTDLMARSDQPAVRYTVIWLGLLMLSGAGGVYSWGFSDLRALLVRLWLALRVLLRQPLVYGGAWHRPQACMGERLGPGHRQRHGDAKAGQLAVEPFLGQVGLVPSRNTFTGVFKAVGKTADTALAFLEEVRAYEAAGAVAVEIQVVPVKVATEISRRVNILLGSMGAGSGCDVSNRFFADVRTRTAATCPVTPGSTAPSPPNLTDCSGTLRRPKASSSPMAPLALVPRRGVPVKMDPCRPGGLALEPSMKPILRWKAV
jgi:hypothetical protein